MSENLTSLIEILKEAENAEDRKNYTDAMYHYSTVLALIARASINDEIKSSHLKEEIQKQIDFCLISTKKLIELQNEKENISSALTHDGDEEKINKRIANT